MWVSHTLTTQNILAWNSVCDIFLKWSEKALLSNDSLQEMRNRCSKIMLLWKCHRICQMKLFKWHQEESCVPKINYFCMMGQQRRYSIQISAAQSYNKFRKVLFRNGDWKYCLPTRQYMTPLVINVRQHIYDYDWDVLCLSFYTSELVLSDFTFSRHINFHLNNQEFIYF